MSPETAKKLQVALQVYEETRTRLLNSSVEEHRVVRAAEQFLDAKRAYKAAVEAAETEQRVESPQ